MGLSYPSAKRDEGTAPSGYVQLLEARLSDAIGATRKNTRPLLPRRVSGDRRRRRPIQIHQFHTILIT